MHPNALSGHDYYTPDPSKQLPGATWTISYGDGSGASGTVYIDEVDLGTLKVANQAIEVAEKVSEQFREDKSNDGLVGLGFSGGNTGELIDNATR